ncbi:hypothetical protein [Sphingomonas sp. TZW2008]|uniref:hypothetical protein n=1 Tax=Sphingomonas sp. TZW2008 TaxID=1917973 RepID=UPI000A26D491|nr:hypothetical protein [Sphingomonas sp. TZW2008]
MNFETYPDRPGFKGDSETGREAADAMKECSGRYRRMALDLVKQRQAQGILPEEAADLTGVPRTTLQPRFSELRAQGLIVDSGMRRRNPSSGKKAVVWVLPQYAPRQDAGSEA